MALDFAARIHALTGFDADNTENTETGDGFDESAAQWMTNAVRDVVNVLPNELKEKCMTETTLNHSSPTMDLDGKGKILYVTRLSADSGGKRVPCRLIPPSHAEMANDEDSLYYASVTDPGYWISSSDDAAILSVLPTPTEDQTAIVYHIGNPTFTAADGGTYDVVAATTIANFPDEAEHLVVLRASIIAAEYLLAIEEDVELYIPIIGNLKAQYIEGIQALLSGNIVPQQKKGDN